MGKEADKKHVLFADILEIKLVLQRNTQSLEEHIRRTELLEKSLERTIERELGCPGRIYAQNLVGISKSIRFIGILGGFILAALQIYMIIKR